MAKKYETITELPEDPKTRAVTLILPVATYDRLKALCEASYRNVPHMLRFLIDTAYVDQELDALDAYNILNPTTVR